MTGFDEPPANDVIAAQANAYRVMQAEQVLKCFKDSVGRAARTMEELDAWAAEHEDEIPLGADGKILPLIK